MKTSIGLFLKKTLWCEIVDFFVARWIACDGKSQSRFYTVAELSELFGVSDARIRRALKNIPSGLETVKEKGRTLYRVAITQESEDNS